MAFLKLFLLRLILWVGLPLLLAALIVGPKRFKYALRRGWDWLFSRRLEPEVILAQVLRQHEEHVGAMRRALAQAETTEAAVEHGLGESQRMIEQLDEEARAAVGRGDELGAKGALYKLNLERAAAQSFDEQLVRQRALIAESRRRLYLLQLQQRQFEVGRSILLSQLAQAKSLEQQYEIASSFDPFNAVANWEKAEGLVHEKALSAQAKERVYVDTSELAASQTVEVDSEMLDTQLAELRRDSQPRAALPEANSSGGDGNETRNNPAKHGDKAPATSKPGASHEEV